MALGAAERAPLPDLATRAGIELLVARTDRRLRRLEEAEEDRFVATMQTMPIARHTDEANSQHYELPTAFFSHALGPHMKYSCCLYKGPDMTLAEAEAAALAETCAHADLRDGQTVLELGCGWGALTLYMAEKFPACEIVSVSNSRSQRDYIAKQAILRSLENVSVMVCDMNDLHVDRRFDRIVSVEMFEHISNWRALLGRLRSALSDDGRLFLHIFTHRSRSYAFDTSDPSDWIAQHFFTGGVMPAHDLPRRFPDLFEVEEEWRWSGLQYQRTALDWLANFDRRRDEVADVLRAVYGGDWTLWRRRWRLFFLATAGLFGHAGGDVWGVGHYRLRPSSGGPA